MLISKLVVRNAASTLVLCALVLLTLSGCASWNPETRANHVRAHAEAVEERTREFLPQDGKLDLEQCIRIALHNNVQVKTAEIQARIARLERRVSFASFLPTLNLDMSYTAQHRQPSGGGFGLMALMAPPAPPDETWGIGWHAQQPIFVPTTWFLYAQHTHGVKIGELLTEYTRQTITLQVTTLYFQGLALQKAEKVIEGQLEAAKTVLHEMVAYRNEGLVSRWQVDQAEALMAGRRTSLHRTQGALHNTKANLLATMGLSPFADISMTPQALLDTPEEALEGLVLQALLANRQLHVADREVAIAHEQMKVAIAAFLPELMGSAGGMATSVSFPDLEFPTSWTSGAEGILSVFNGFANVNQYRVARQRKRVAYLQREEACTTIVLQVIRAYLSVLNAQGEVTLADKVLAAASGRLAEIEAQWMEGLIRPSERLERLAEKDAAEVDVFHAESQRQVAIATLRNILGEEHNDNDEQEDDDES